MAEPLCDCVWDGLDVALDDLVELAVTDADRLGACDADLVPDAEAVPENDIVPEAEDVDERLRDGVPVLEDVPVAL